jgi:cytochrome c-type biogenesis protein CcmF
MYFGNLVFALAFAACALSAASYYLAFAGQPRFQSLGKRSYIAFSFLTAILVAVFLYQILSHNFSIEYVHSYSSTDLSPFLLISTFWAGQIGTFMLWLLFTTIVGLILHRRSDPMNSAVMFYYMLGALFLFVLLTAGKPFHLLPETPVEGRGLNPLLQNFWMIIHPPIVFFGFTLLAVPFSFALAALTRNDYSTWNRSVMPWSLAAMAVLGLGIFLGGYWAYETLGWGGYWAWDPVENASLIPWLTNTALVHGLFVERKAGQLRRTNLLLAAFGFLFVVYGTFLTRSGVLADFSVHSFTDLGLNIYLILFLFTFILLALGFFFARYRSIRPSKRMENPWSTEFMMALGLAITTALALLTLVGTSSPLITRIPIFDAPANVAVEYYNRFAMPVAILMAILSGLAPLLAIKTPSVGRVVRLCVPSLLAAVAGIVIAAIVGVVSLRHFVLVFFAVFTLAANVQTLILFPHKIGWKMGGHMAHVGLGVLLIGILSSSAFSASKKLTLAKDKPAEVLGFALTYSGMAGDMDQKDNSLNIQVERAGKKFEARPKIYIDKMTGGTMKSPYVQAGILSDLYIAPEQVETEAPGSLIRLAKGEADTIDGLEILFNGFDMASHGEDGAIKVGALLTVIADGDTVEVTPYLSLLASGERDRPTVRAGDTGVELVLEDVHPDIRTADIRVSSPGSSPSETVSLEVSTKPLISLVWMGSLLIVFGAAIAAFHRRRFSSMP